MMATFPGISRRNLAWPLLVAGVIFLASSRSSVAAPNVAHSDKAGHFLMYGLLGTLLARLGRSSRAAWLALAATSFFGVSDEWHQSFVAGRSSEFGDWIADTAGAALAIALYAGWPWYRRTLEAELPSKRRVEKPPSAATVEPA